MALVTVAVVAFAATSVFYVIGNRYQTTFHSASWQEALVVAESGGDTALAALNMTLTDPTNAWNDWTTTSTDPSNPNFPKTFTGTIPRHGGDGNQKMYVSVTVENSYVDASGTRKYFQDTTGQNWYRVRSRGTVELPGLKRTGYEPAVLSSNGMKNHKSLLRKLSLNADVTGGKLNAPQVSRSVELLAQPMSSGMFAKSLLAKYNIVMSGGAYTDSFDSSDPAKSTNGQYDQTKRQKHGDIATNITGNSSNLMSSYVYGNASSNTGQIQNTQNVQGTVYNNFSTTIQDVKEPTTTFTTFNASPSTINNPNAPVTLYGGTQAAPANYILTTLTVSNSANPLILSPPTTGGDGYINIWVKGKLTTSGSGFIKQLAGTHVNIWVDGDVTVSGSAFLNQTGNAANLMISGVTPTDGSTNKYTVSGSANFIGVVNAPAYALTISGGGDYMGAIIAYNATISGAAGFHYDEALGKIGGQGSGYKVASWIEDIQ